MPDLTFADVLAETEAAAEEGPFGPVLAAVGGCTVLAAKIFAAITQVGANGWGQVRLIVQTGIGIAAALVSKLTELLDRIVARLIALTAAAADAVTDAAQGAGHAGVSVAQQIVAWSTAQASGAAAGGTNSVRKGVHAGEGIVHGIGAVTSKTRAAAGRVHGKADRNARATLSSAR